MPAFLAFLAEPATWAIGVSGAWLGSLFTRKVTDPVIPAQDTYGQSVNWNAMIFYAAAALALAYGFKKVFK